MKVYHLWHRGSVDKRLETKLAHVDESVFLNEQQNACSVTEHVHSFEGFDNSVKHYHDVLHEPKRQNPFS